MLKISNNNFLLIKANKIIRHHYQLARQLSKSEIIDEAKNLIRKSLKENLDDSQERLFSSLKDEEWKIISELQD